MFTIHPFDNGPLTHRGCLPSLLAGVIMRPTRLEYQVLISKSYQVKSVRRDGQHQHSDLNDRVAPT
jgi:hypothetical protein